MSYGFQNGCGTPEQYTNSFPQYMQFSTYSNGSGIIWAEKVESENVEFLPDGSQVVTLKSGRKFIRRGGTVLCPRVDFSYLTDWSSLQ